MTVQSVNYLEHISPTDIEILTQLLILTPGQKPNKIWLQDQANCLTQFPFSLLKPSSVLLSLRMALPTADNANLCKTHKLLNPQLIREIFLELSAEVTARQKTLEQNPLLSSILSDHLIRLRSAASLWIEPTLFRTTYPTHPSNQCLPRIASGCEACILAAIGGNHTILSSLCTSILGRKKKGHPQAPLLPFVNAWIDWTGEGDAIRAGSDAVMKEVRKCRRQMQKTRRQTRRDSEAEARTESIPLLNAGEAGEEEHNRNIEDKIVDSYTGRSSEHDLDDDEKGNNTVDIHFRVRGPVFLNAAKGTFEESVPEPVRLRKYSASVYSVEQSHGASSNHETGGVADAQEELSSILRAQAYRHLVGLDEDEQTEDFIGWKHKLN